MCYKFLACESKMASIFSGQFSGQPTELPTISILESSGLLTELHTELPTISVYGSGGQLYLHCKIPVGSPLSCPLFSHLEVVGCPLFQYMEVVGSLLSCPLFPYMDIVGSLLRCPLFPYMEVVSSLICMAKFPWAAHSVAHVQPTGSEVGSSPVCFFRMGKVSYVQK